MCKSPWGPSHRRARVGSRASAWRAWSRRNRARLRTAHNSQNLAPCSSAMLRALRYSSQRPQNVPATAAAGHCADRASPLAGGLLSFERSAELVQAGSNLLHFARGLCREFKGDRSEDVRAARRDRSGLFRPSRITSVGRSRVAASHRRGNGQGPCRRDRAPYTSASVSAGKPLTRVW